MAIGKGTLESRGGIVDGNLEFASYDNYLELNSMLPRAAQRRYLRRARVPTALSQLHLARIADDDTGEYTPCHPSRKL